jgi:hypothetical protein
VAPLTGFAGFCNSVVLAGVGAGLAVVAGTGSREAFVPVVGLAGLVGFAGFSVCTAGTGASGASAALALAEGVLFGEVANGFFNSMAPG